MAVLNLNANWSADGTGSGTFPSDGSDWIGRDGGQTYRTAIEFDITSLPAADTVSQVDFGYDLTAEEDTGNFTIGPYNGDGQGEASADSDADLFARCEVSGDNYGSDLYMAPPETTKTISDLGVTAEADLEAARDAGIYFNLGWRRADETPTSALATIGEFSDSGNEPTLTITHSAAAAATLDQERFAFGDDDGSESAHTIGSENADYTGLNGTKTLRLQIDGTNDPANIAYKLKYQKNGAGGYVDVPVGASSGGAAPVIEPGDTNETNTNATLSAHTLTVPAVADGDLVILCDVYWNDNNDDITVTMPATGRNGESVTTAVDSYRNPIANVDGVGIGVGWYIADGAEAGGTVTLTYSLGTRHQGGVIVVPAGEFDPAKPLSTVFGQDNSTANTSPVTMPSFTANSDDGNGTLVAIAGVDQDVVTGTPAGWTLLQRNDAGRSSWELAVRDAAVSADEVIPSADWTIAGDAWAAVGFIVRPAPGATNEVYIDTSANVAAGGEATTGRLTAASGSFTTGRRWDDENGNDGIDIGDGDFTELEWVITTSGAANNDYFDFRVYNVDAALDTYTETPRWTIGSGSTEAGAGTVAVSAQMAVGGGQHKADGTISIGPAVTAIGTSISSTVLGSGIIVSTGQVVASGVITARASISLGFAARGNTAVIKTATATINLSAQADAGVGTTFVYAQGTVDFVATLIAGGGQHRANGSVNVAANVAAAGTETTGGIVTASGAVFVFSQSVAGGIKTGKGVATIAPVVSAIGVDATAGIQTGAGTIALAASVSANGVDLSSSVLTASGTVYVFSRSVASGTRTGKGVATIAANVSAVGQSGTTVSTGAGTVALSAALNAVGTVFSPATASINLSAQAQAAGLGLARGTISLSWLSSVGSAVTRTATASILATANLQSAGQAFRYGSGVISFPITLTAAGLSTIPATTGAGIIQVTPNVNAKGIRYCPVRSVGTIAMPMSVAAAGVYTDIRRSKASIAGLVSASAQGVDSLDEAGSIDISVGLSASGLSNRYCPVLGKASSTIYPAQVSAVGSITDIGFGFASIGIHASLSSAPPKITNESVRLDFSLSARMRQVRSADGNAESRFATGRGAAFSGRGLINGIETLIIDEAYGSVEFYSNNLGSFFTIGSAGGVREAKGTIIISPVVEAVGDGDALKTRTGLVGHNTRMTAYGTNVAQGNVVVSADLRGVVRATASIGMNVQAMAQISGITGSTISASATLAARGNAPYAFGSVSLSASMSAIGQSINLLTLDLSQITNVVNNKVGGGQADAGCRLTSTGFFQEIDEDGNRVTPGNLFVTAGNPASVYVERTINLGAFEIDDIGAGRVGLTANPDLVVQDPGNSSCTFTFRFYDAPSGGNLVGSKQILIEAQYEDEEGGEGEGF